MTPTLMTLMDSAPLLLAPSTLEAVHDTPDTKEDRGRCSNPQPARAVDGTDDNLGSACRRAFVRGRAGVTNASALVASKRPNATVPATAIAVRSVKYERAHTLSTQGAIFWTGMMGR